MGLRVRIYMHLSHVYIHETVAPHRTQDCLVLRSLHPAGPLESGPPPPLILETAVSFRPLRITRLLR